VSKRLLLLNVLLGGVCLFCLAFIVQQLVSAPVAERRHPVTPSSGPVVAAPEIPRPAVSAYNVIASRSLFSPSRSEAPAATAGAAIGGPKPNLYGVVVRDTNPIAYLEDPLTKRVAGYRIGDAIAGGTVKVITADNVVITRSDGNIDVRLRDPSKPRPIAPRHARAAAGARFSHAAAAGRDSAHAPAGYAAGHAAGYDPAARHDAAAAHAADARTGVQPAHTQSASLTESGEPSPLALGGRGHPTAAAATAVA